MRFANIILAFCLTANVAAQTADNQSPDAQALLSLTPEQIQKIIQELDARQKASIAGAHGTAKGTPKTLRVNFRGGAAAETIPLVDSKLSVLGFYDSLMQPWKIKNMRASGGERFEIHWEEDSGTHSILLKSMQPYATGNMVVYLEGANEPLIINLVTVPKEFHDKINIVIGQLSPASQASVVPPVESLLSKKNTHAYYEFMDGRPPTDAREVIIPHNSIIEAWRYNGELIVLSDTPLLGLINGKFHTVDKLILHIFEDVGEIGVPTPDNGIQLVEVPYGD